MLIMGGIVVIIGVLIWMLYPLKTKLLPAGSTPGGKNQPTQGGGASNQTPKISPEEQQEQQLQDALKQQASSFTARQGSYSSVDSFESIRLASLDASADVQTVLQNTRQDLLQAHPAYGSSWGQTTHVLSARIISALPIGTKISVDLVVQAQVTVTAAGVKSAPTYQEFSVTLQKVGTKWFVSKISVQALAL